MGADLVYMLSLGKTKATETDKGRGDRPVAICIAIAGLLSEIKPVPTTWSLIIQTEPKGMCPIRAQDELNRFVGQGRCSLGTTERSRHY